MSASLAMIPVRSRLPVTGSEMEPFAKQLSPRRSAPMVSQKAVVTLIGCLYSKLEKIQAKLAERECLPTEGTLCVLEISNKIAVLREYLSGSNRARGQIGRIIEESDWKMAKQFLGDPRALAAYERWKAELARIKAEQVVSSFRSSGKPKDDDDESLVESTVPASLLEGTPEQPNVCQFRHG